MKIVNLFEELSEFEPLPPHDDAGKIRFMQTKLQSLSHHRAILLPVLHELDELNDEGKLTPALKQKLAMVQAKLKNINAQFKQFDIKIGTSKVANPLATCELSLYAGPPEGYPDLTGSQKKLYAEIQDILAKAGIAPLVVLYGGRRNPSYRGINFVAVNADHTFAWRKYDPSPGAGQNWVYTAGASKRTSQYNKKTGKWEDKEKAGQMNTSDFVGSPGKVFPALAKPKKSKK